MLLRYGLKLNAEADAVAAAIRKTLADGLRTGDIMQDGCKSLNTQEMGQAVLERL